MENTEVCYVVIDGKEYFFSDTVFINLDGMKDDYIEFKNDKKYLNIEKLKNEGNYPLLRRIYDKCNLWTGMLLMGAQDITETTIPEVEEFGKMGEMFRNIDFFSDYNFKKGNVSKACNLVIEGIKLSLKPYNDFLTNDSVHKDKSR